MWCQDTAGDSCWCIYRIFFLFGFAKSWWGEEMRRGVRQLRAEGKDVGQARVGPTQVQQWELPSLPPSSYVSLPVPCFVPGLHEHLNSQTKWVCFRRWSELRAAAWECVPSSFVVGSASGNLVAAALSVTGCYGPAETILLLSFLASGGWELCVKPFQPLHCPELKLPALCSAAPALGYTPRVTLLMVTVPTAGLERCWMGSVLGGTSGRGSCFEFGRNPQHLVLPGKSKHAGRWFLSCFIRNVMEEQLHQTSVGSPRSFCFSFLVQKQQQLWPYSLHGLCLWLHFSVNIRFKTGDIRQQKPEIQVMFCYSCIAVSCSSLQKPCPHWIPVHSADRQRGTSLTPKSFDKNE